MGRVRQDRKPAEASQQILSLNLFLMALALSMNAELALSINAAFASPLPVRTPPSANLHSTASTPRIIDASSLQGSKGLNLARGSTTIIDFTNNKSVSMSGSISNAGRLIFAGSSPKVGMANFSAASIQNLASGRISTFLPSATSIFNLNSVFSIRDLTLTSQTYFTNQGRITSAGNLTIEALSSFSNSGTVKSNGTLVITSPSITNSMSINSAGNLYIAANSVNNSGHINSAMNLIVQASSILNAPVAGINAVINTDTNLALISAAQNIDLRSSYLLNQGLINAEHGNLKIASEIVGDVTVNNQGGRIQAATGSINIRDENYAGSGNLLITGGALVSPTLNLNNGNGLITSKVEEISGVVNATGYGAHVGVVSKTLSLGNIKMTGDPTYENDSGSISITGNIRVGEDLTIIAAGDISTTAGVSSISTTDTGGLGHNITLIAGAQITASGTGTSVIGTTPPVTGNANTNVSVTGGGTGGNIDFHLSPNLTISSASTCAGCRGGDIVLAAFGNSTTGGGNIFMPGPAVGQAGSALISSATRGAAGNITIIAGASAAITPTIQIGRISATGNSAASSGTVSISTAQPVISDGKALIFDVQGKLISHNSLIPSGTLSDVGVDLADNVKANKLNIQSGGRILSLDEVVAQVQTGGNPTNTIINSTGTRVFTVDTTLNLVDVIDTSSNTVIAKLVTGSGPVAVELNPSGTILYVAEFNSNDVKVYNVSTHKLITTLSGFNSPSSLAVNANGSQLYVANSASNTISVIDTKTFKSLPSFTLTGSPQSLAYVNAGSFLITTLSGSNTIDSINTVNRQQGSITLASAPYSLGPCPCGTKFFTPTVGGKVDIVALNPPGPVLAGTIDINSGPQSIGTGILPNGSYAYFANPNDSSISIYATLTDALKSSVTIPVNNNVSGAFAGFVGSNPVAYVPDGAQVAVLRTAAIQANTVILNAPKGDISVAGATGTYTVAALNVAIVTGNGNFTSTSASASQKLQYATTRNVTLNGPTSAGVEIDLHAISGTFINNSTMTVSGKSADLLFIASPKSFNNGSILINGGSTNAIDFQAPNGTLNLVTGIGSMVSATAGSTMSIVNLNNAGGSSITVSGDGTIGADSFIQANGSANNFTVKINIKELEGSFQVPDKVGVVSHQPTALSISTKTGDIVLSSDIDTSPVATGSGGAIFLHASNGAVSGKSLTSNGSGVGKSAGSITVKASGAVSFTGSISSIGLNGANGGKINISGDPVNIGVVGQSQASVDASSSSANGGTINLLSLDSTDQFMLGCQSCINGTTGNIAADGGGSGGRINLTIKTGLSLSQGTGISTLGTNGAGGVVQILGVPGQMLNVQNDGSIFAMTMAKTPSGEVGFNSFRNGGVALTGKGSTAAGAFIAMGNLNPTTALPINPFVPPFTNPFQFLSFSAVQSLLTSPIVVSFAPPTPPVVSGSSGSSSGTSVRLGGQTSISQFQPLSLAVPGFLITPIDILPNTTISADDQTPLSRQTTIVFGFFQKRERSSSQDDSIQAAIAFSADSQPLIEQGVQAASGKTADTISLKNGNVLFIAKQNLIVSTDFGDIRINAGNVVLILATPNSVNAFNLHDETTRTAPTVTSLNKSISFGVGSEILLRSQSGNGFNNKIAFRQQAVLARNKNVEFHSAQFSIPSAINAVRALKQLQKSNDPLVRKTNSQIIKNAAILSIVGARSGSFTTHPDGVAKPK